MGLGQMDKLDIKSIDHIVMQTVDVPETIKFYTEILGMTHSEFQPPTGGPVRQSLHFGAQKINLHEASAPFLPHARHPTAGSVDLCFITQQSIGDWQQHLAKCGIVIEYGPVRKTGANGPLLSIYIRDLDGNLIEISNYI
jgi:catechol 2,3-dioxygenase-like lactoylglutathione lyase family enzyme